MKRLLLIAPLLLSTPAFADRFERVDATTARYTHDQTTVETFSLQNLIDRRAELLGEVATLDAKIDGASRAGVLTQAEAAAATAEDIGAGGIVTP